MPNTPEIWLDQQQVNTSTGGTQFDPALTQLANGNILQVWSDAADGNVMGRLYDALGEAAGGEFRINSLESVAADADVTALADGGFLAVYESDDGGADDLAYEVFDSSGTQLRNGRLANDSGGAGYRDAAVAAQTGDGALAAYVDEGGAGALAVRSLDPAAGTRGGERTIFSDNEGNLGAPDTAALSNGDYAVVFVDRDPGNDTVRFSVRDADGSGVTGGAVASGPGEQRDVQIAALANGGFVVAWTSQAGGASDIRARAFDNAGDARGGAFTVNAGGGVQKAPAVNALADGGFVVAWDDNGDGAISARRFDADANRVGGEFDIATAGTQSGPALQGLADGRFAAGFTQDSSATDGDDVFLELYDPRDNANADPVYSPTSAQIGTIGDDDVAVTGDFAAGRDGDDVLRGDAADNRIAGDDGADTLAGGGGDDLLDGDAGADVVNGEGGSDNLFGGTGGDELSGGAQDDTVRGNAGDDDLRGGTGNDALLGGSGNDDLRAGPGADRLVGEEGNDTLTAGSGGLAFRGFFQGVDNFGISDGWTSQNRFPRQVADIDGDGAADIVGFGGPRTFSATADGDGSFSGFRGAIENFGQDQFWNSFNANPRLLGDIDDDGAADALGFGDNTTLAGLARGDGTFGDVSQVIQNFSQGQFWDNFNDNPRAMGDIDGDGDDDILGFGDSITLSALSNGDGSFQPASKAIANFSQGQFWDNFNDNPRLIGDIDGDGADDILGFGDSITLSALSNGDGTFQAAEKAIENFSRGQFWNSFDANPRAMGDVNGDKMEDIVGFGDGETFAALSNGDGTFQAARPVTTAFSQDQGWSSQNAMPRTVADVDGDGTEDLVGFNADGPVVGLSVTEDTFVFRDGFGADTITDFEPLGDGEIVDFSGVSAFDNFNAVDRAASQQGSDTVIDAGGGDELTLSNVDSDNLDAEHFIF